MRLAMLVNVLLTRISFHTGLYFRAYISGTGQVAALSFWLERALAGLPSPLLELNRGIRFHVIWFSCYEINGHEGGQNMAYHGLNFYS